MTTKPRIIQRPGDLVAAGALAVLATAADMIRSTTGLTPDPAYLAHWLMYAAAFWVCLRLASAALDWLSAGGGTDEATGTPSPASPASLAPTTPIASPAPTPLFDIPTTYRPAGIASTATALLACWSPWLILLYPGVIWYDSRQQLLQYFGLRNVFTNGGLSDHHPVFDTMLYGSFVRFGQWVGSADLGAWLFTVVQAAATACALAAALTLIRRCGASRRCVLATAAVLAFWPQVPVYAAAMAKDATFLPFLLAFSVMAVEAMRSHGGAFACPPFALGFLAAAALMCLTRKTGLIVVLLVAAAVFVAVRGVKARVQVAGTTLTCVALMAVVMPAVVLPALGAVPGGRQEALGLMFQQSARLLRDHGDDVPDWQRSTIRATLGDDVENRYSWWMTDTVKDETIDRQDTLARMMPAYAKAWAAGLAEHPGSYVQTYLAVEIGWYAVPVLNDGNTVMYLTPIDGHETDHTFAGSTSIGFVWSDTTIGQALENTISWFQGTPLGMIVGAKAFWSTWALAFLLLECRRRAPGRLPWLMPLVAANLVLWISPTSVTREAMRYLLPMFFLMPITVALIAGAGPTSEPTRKRQPEFTLRRTVRHS